MSLKPVSVMPLIFSLLLLLAAAQPGYARNIRLKIATLSPDGSMWVEKMLDGARQVAEATENRVTLKFYTSGRMGNDKMVLKKIKIGQLHGGAVVSGSMSQFFPANQLYSQPMKFKSLEEVDYVRQHMDNFILKGLESAGFITFGLIGGGFAYIMSKHPVVTVEDLRKQKVWIPDNDRISQDAIKAFGISPIPLPLSDVRISLQSGLIDTVATSPVGAIVLQWYTQVKYLTFIPLVYLHAVLAIDKDQFMKISPEDQKIVKTIMTKVSKEIQEQNRRDDLQNIEVLKSRGIEFITPDPDALMQWYRVAANASREMVESGVIPASAAQELDGYLETFNRTGQAANAR